MESIPTNFLKIPQNGGKIPQIFKNTHKMCDREKLEN